MFLRQVLSLGSLIRLGVLARSPRDPPTSTFPALQKHPPAHPAFLTWILEVKLGSPRLSAELSPQLQGLDL